MQYYSVRRAVIPFTDCGMDPCFHINLINQPDIHTRSPTLAIHIQGTAFAGTATDATRMNFGPVIFGAVTDRSNA